MLELLLTQPRLLAGALIGLLIGFLGALALHSFFPAASPFVSAVLVAVALALGVGLGAAWEAKRS
jgi:hypothetical protein